MKIGLAAASAARILGVKSTICVTLNTPQNILNRLYTEGAEVRQIGSFWSDADDLCRKLVAEDPNGVYTPPPLAGRDSWRWEVMVSYIVRHLIMRILLLEMQGWCMK